MDNPSGASNNDTNQQLSGMSTPIVSTLTTATPITSEIVSDFEPDPKFEITTLEMASYDCQDIYATTNLREEHNPEQLLADNADSREVQDASQQQTDNLAQAEQVILVSHGDSHDALASHIPIEQLNPSNFDETPQNSGSIGSKSPEKLQEQSQQKHVDLNTNVDTTLSNDCKPEQFTRGSFASGSSSLSFAQVEPNAKPDPNLNIDSSKIVITNYDKPREFEFDTSAELSSADHAIKDSDNLTFPLSQTSVDAQMEKVIDNIVELGGVHQFPQSFGHPEGREEILASIHREITSERSSIDLIADVASRQKSIEIEPMMEQGQHSSLEKKDSDILGMDIPEKEVVSISKQPGTSDLAEIQANSVEFRVSEKSTDELFVSKEEVTDTKLTDEETAQTKLIQDNVVNEKLIREEIIDERLIQEVVTEEKLIQEEITEVHVPEQDVIERAEEQVREAAMKETSKEDAKQDTLKEAKKEVRDEQTKVAVREEKTKVEVTRLTEEMSAPTPSRTRGKKINEGAKDEFKKESKNEAKEEVVGGSLQTLSRTRGKKVHEGVKNFSKEEGKEAVIEADTKEPLLPSTKTRGKKYHEDVKIESKMETHNQVEEEVIGEPTPTTSRTRGKKIHEKAKDEAKVEPCSTHSKTRGKKTQEGAEEEPYPTPVSEQPNSDLNKPAEHPVDNSTEQTSNDNSVQEMTDDIGQSIEHIERRPRSLRPRESLKRAHVDDTLQENPPKVEPPKKQLKKSRGSISEAAPLIKLPNFRSRSTISTSDPISRLDNKYEATRPTSNVQVETEKKFKCHQCGYATDRLNNLVYHSTKSFCTGKCQIGEVMKADIIKQQQQAKNKRRSIR